jgi:hypothetical protein
MYEGLDGVHRIPYEILRVPATWYDPCDLHCESQGGSIDPTHEFPRKLLIFTQELPDRKVLKLESFGEVLRAAEYKAEVDKGLRVHED